MKRWDYITLSKEHIIMKHLGIQQIINDPSARVENYKQMVQAYYDQVTDAYRKDWGDSFYFCFFSREVAL